MKRALLHDTSTEIFKSLNRFLAIAVIVALGVGFLYGIKATSPSMKYTADAYYDAQRFMDLRFLSPIGFTREDAEALRGQQGIGEVFATYSLDALIQTDGGLKSVRLHALPPEDGGMNMPVLVSGRLPESANECVVDHKQAGVLGTIGTEITISDKNEETALDILGNKRYTIVGFVQSPLYIDYANRGAISIGDGSIYCFMYIPSENFISDYYTDLLARVQGAEALSCYSEAYGDLMDGVVARMKPFADERVGVRINKILRDANAELTSANKALLDARTEAARQAKEARDGIDKATAAIADAEEQIADGDKKLNDASGELAQNKAEFAGKAADAQKKIDAAESKLNAGKKQYNEGAAALKQGKAKLAQMNAQTQALMGAGKILDALMLQAQATALSNEISEKEPELKDAQASIKKAEKELKAKKTELAKAKADAKAKLEKADAQIAARAAELAKARAELAKAKEDLAKAKEEYAEAQRKANDSFAEAEANIQKLRDKIAEIEQTQWYVTTRDDSIDYVNFGADAKRVDALSSVFPIFFYLIAALVCLTTLTRMVEEQRTQVGVLRALGYSRGAVAFKYLVYAALASVLGSAAGLALGHYVLPRLIYRTYETTYTIPALTVPFDLGFALLAALLAILVNVLAALWACYRAVSSVPAELIRPRAPAPGKRVLLERIPFIWCRLSFFSKVTVRNLFRFKKRFFMTVLGICGCTALLLAGFGIRDSIAGTVPRQYYGLHSYNLFLSLIDAGSARDQGGLNAQLPVLLDDWLYVYENKVAVDGLDRAMTTYLFVPEDAEKAADFISFHNRPSGDTIAFPEPGRVILTERIAAELGIAAGDTVRIKREDDAQYVELTVGGVTENYVYNYIYMSPEDYAKQFGAAPGYKMVLGKAPNGEAVAEAEEKALTTKLLDCDNVLAATMISSLKREFTAAMKNLDAVVMVIILCACLLNFVVLYNLTNINITERTREIATTKVLGFFNREVAAYINREIVALTFFGIALGLAGGVFLHRFTIETAEVDILMYMREMKPLSYVWSALLTALFTAVINFAIQFRLRRIKMVESLKSVE